MIQLTKDLWMKADDCCYIVGKLNKKRSEGVQGGCKANILRSPTYYSTAAQAVSGALVRAMRQGVADGSITTLREFIREQERLQAELETLIAPLGGGTPRQKVVEAHQAAETGNYISQSQDGEKEA